MYELEFTSVQFPPVDGIQLGSLALLGIDDELLSIASITNPGGVNPNNQGPSQLIDYQPSSRSGIAAALVSTSSSKWFDGSFGATGSSTLRITLTRPAVVAAYWFATTHDVRRRDPVSWTLRVSPAGGDMYVVDRRERVTPPVSRNALYPLIYLVSPPSPPLSPPPPLPQVCSSAPTPSATISSSRTAHVSGL